MIVKICGITNRDDAVAAIQGGASALGFNFYKKSPRFISRRQVTKIIRELPRTVCKVGIFVNEPPEFVALIARELTLDVVQLHGDETSDQIPRGIRVWKAFRVNGGLESERLADFPAEAILLDGPSSGQTFDWSIASGIAPRVILAGGLDAGNVRQAIEQARPWGVDACSLLESAPGRKDRVKMAAFLKAATNS